jgi:hypothetical protein
VRTNYILIDFENVQPDSLEQLERDHFKLLVFVGASQGKLRNKFAASLQRLGNRAKCIKISGHGRNALDFHIAYYIGRLAVDDQTSSFCIISKDAGFDPLIDHLKEKKIMADRAVSVSDIPLFKSSNSKSAERTEIVVKKLRGLKGKPKTLKALRSTIAALFQKQLSEKEVAGLIKALSTRGYLCVSGNKVNYAL